METLNLKEIIKKSGLKKEEIAQNLFPGIKYPVLALNRVINGHANLDSTQMSKLALILGTKIEDLYKSNWNSSSKGSEHVFIKGNHKAILNSENWSLRIYDQESLFHETVLTSPFIPLGEFIQMLDLLIKNK